LKGAGRDADGKRVSWDVGGGFALRASAGAAVCGFPLELLTIDLAMRASKLKGAL